MDANSLRAWRLLLALRTTRQAPSLVQVLLLRSRIADLDPSDTDNPEPLDTGALIPGRSLLTATAVGDRLRREGETERSLELAARRDPAVGRMEAAEGHAKKLLAVAPEVVPAYALALAAAGRVEEGRRVIGAVDRTTIFPEMRALPEKNGL